MANKTTKAKSVKPELLKQLGIDPDKLVAEAIGSAVTDRLRPQVREALMDKVASVVEVILSDMAKSGALRKKLQPVINRVLNETVSGSSGDLDECISEQVWEALAEHASSAKVTIEPGPAKPKKNPVRRQKR